MAWTDLRVGYSPISRTMQAPGDRRRFVNWANKRRVPFESADPARDYDLVVLSQAADISVWASYPPRAKIVFDLVDSYLALPRADPKSMLRGLAKFIVRDTRRLRLDYRKALEEMCRRADAVVCTTEEQRQDILPLCPNVHIVLDVHSGLIRATKTNYEIGETLNLVWEGLPENVGDFKEIAPVLIDLAGVRPVALHLVTDLRRAKYMRKFGKEGTDRVARRLFENCYVYEWNDEMLSPIVTACDMALIPLDLTSPLARGKPENKLLLMWRMGMPTITSATPAYLRAMEACGLEAACATEQDWASALARYMNDRPAREAAGRAGREYSERVHGEVQILERWDHVFESLFPDTTTPVLRGGELAG